MKKKNIIVLIVVVLGLLLLFLFFIKKSPNTKLLGNLGNSQADTPAGELVKGTLQELLGYGKNLKCTFTQKDDKTNTKADMYVSGTKFRLDSTSTDSENKEIGFHQISDGEWIYIWSSEQEEGMKMKYTELQKSQTSNSEPQAVQKNAELANNYNYNCLPWVSDSSKFNVPANIQFQDLTETMKGFQDAAEGMSKDLCNTCERLGDQEQKDACRASLKCE